LALQSKTTLPNVAINYLQQLKVPFTKKALKGYLTENAFYPSLFSISDTLDKYQVPNEAYSVEAEHFDQLVPPFVAYCKHLPTGKDFVLVTAMDSQHITYIGENEKPVVETKEKFMQMWENVVLIAESGAQSGEPDYAKNLEKQKKAANKTKGLIAAGVALLVLSLALLFGGLSGDGYWQAGWLTVTKLLGTATAVLLLVYELDKSNAFVKNLCTAGKQTNCDAVLNSKASGIAGIKWSEAGFFYFAATTLFLLYPGIDFAAKLPWLAIAATGVALYIPFSIYYQYKVVKQWCPLCIATQAVLLLEATWAVVTYWLQPTAPLFAWPLLVTIAICILLPVAVWYALKQVLHHAKDKPLYEAGYKRLLYNPDYFNQLLQEQSQAPDGWQQLGINIGNPEAPTTIIKVCNPYCGPCAKAHPVLEEIVHRNHNVQLKVIFTASNKEEDRAAQPVKHLLAIAARNDAALTQKAMDDWYMAERKDYNAFAAQYPLNGEMELQGDKVDAMSKWCNEAGIVATPTIFINGRQLPESYQIAELKNILS
jgi:uncharacterized membrane protein/thiol-disulfide isomerase/thioredoxin